MAEALGLQEETRPLGQWSETEIRLRVNRLLRVYDLSIYEGRLFADEQELYREAISNRKKAKIDKNSVGGIWYNLGAEPI